MSKSIPSVTKDDDLESYWEAVKNLYRPPEDIPRLIEQWRIRKDEKTRCELITGMMKIVVHILFDEKYEDYELPFHELITEGNIGLAQAIEGFKTHLNIEGARLFVYTCCHVKKHILEHILKEWDRVTITKRTDSARRRLLPKIGEIKNKIESIETGYAGFVNDFSQSLSSDGYETWQIWKKTEFPEQEIPMMRRDNQDLIQQAKRYLKQREREIFEAMHESENPVPVSVLAKRYKVSKQRIHVIDQKTQEKVREKIKELEKLQEAYLQEKKNLKPRDADIFFELVLSLNPPTAEDLAEHHEITPARVSQIKNKVLKHLMILI